MNQNQDTDSVQDYIKSLKETFKRSKVRDISLANFPNSELAILQSAKGSDIFKLIVKFLTARNVKSNTIELIQLYKQKTLAIKADMGVSINEAKLLAMQDIESRAWEAEAIINLPDKAKNELDIRHEKEKQEKEDVKETQE
jgi:hypothetical protein